MIGAATLATSILNETKLGLRAAARECPPLRDDKAVNASTVWRWVRVGILRNGVRVKLEAIRLGSRWVTSREALLRFSAALIAADSGVTAGATGPTPTPEDEQDAKVKRMLGM